jgi:non-specific serine/threonine protein kinase
MRRPGIVAWLVAVAVTVAACSDSQPPRSAAPDGDSPVASPQAAATPGELGDAESFGGQTTPAEANGTAPAEANGDDGGMAQSGWSTLTPSGSPRTEVAAAAHLDKVWAVGGLDGDGAASADVDVYAPTFDAWEPGPPLPRAVHHAAVVAHDDDLLVVGGYVGDGFDTPTDAVWRLDSATGRWRPGPALPEARAAGAAASDGDRVIYAGGVGPQGLAGDVWALADGAWRRLDGLAQPREHLAAAGDDGRVWLLGGRTGGLKSNVAAVDLVDGDAATPIGKLPTARGGLAGFFHPEVGACAVGGEGPQATFAEVECLDADGEAATLASLGRARHGLGAAVAGDIAYAVMGGPQPGLVVSDTIEGLTLNN